MTAHTAEIPVDLACDRCGYDLRAQPRDGKCPECGESVAESQRLAAIPRRPAWRDSDPRWRRRVLAGVWFLALLPLIDVLRAFDWASSVPVPTIFDGAHALHTLDDTLLSYPGVYQPLVFCAGVALLFSKERGRRRNRLDWTHRWGVICSYVVLLLCATQFLFIAALVVTGIAALLQSMPLEYQPGVTPSFVEFSTAYFRYGPQPMDGAGVVLVAFSSAAMLLACVPLYDALRSSGPRRLAWAVLAPLALFALMYLTRAGRYFAAWGLAPIADFLPYGVYFRPELLVSGIAALPYAPGLSAPAGAVWVEAAKWCSVLAVAVWLTVVRLAAWRHGKKPGAA